MNRALCATASLLVLIFFPGCIPYTVGETAQPENIGELVPYSGLTWLPVGSTVQTDSTTERSQGSLLLPRIGMRVGLDHASDVRVELPGLLGIVVGYKRRLSGAPDATTWATALSGSAGWVNGGEHVFIGGTFYVSGPENQRTVVPYSGLRFMHVFPRWDNAVEDEPVIGGFVGFRLGNGDMSVSPELGVYYDESALGIRSDRIILVPGLTIRGLALNAFFW